MSEAGIQRDLRFLASELPHRGANTDSERAAADYIQKRFHEYTPDASLDDFYSIESYYHLFASYYAEFAIVAVVAFWSPLVALVYGAVVLLAYLFEFLGYHTFSLLLPQYETQNVMAQFLATDPKQVFVVSAHYDSPRDGMFTHPHFVPWLRTAHLAITACMALVVISCATETVGIFDGFSIPVDLVARWTAVGVLLSAAFVFFYSAMNCDYVRGANGNASGVAALINLAERLAENPIEQADVCLLATGSKDSWMNGIRHFIKGHTLDRDYTYFLNIENVGAGELHYTVEEGMLQTMPSAPELVRAAEAAAGKHGAKPCGLRTVPTDAQIPLARGFRAMSIVALDAEGVPRDWHWYT
ncbi:MAG: family peptidase, partial [Candidatus Hydrogenedentes bacterium]|nr:family peptidase [Candidatus Hydrogenedentota bacterium]